MLDQIHHTALAHAPSIGQFIRVVVVAAVGHLLQHLIDRVFRQREHMFDRILFFLIDPAAFDTDGIH